MRGHASPTALGEREHVPKRASSRIAGVSVTTKTANALAREIEEQARLVQTADAAEGIAAMLQRREPRFTGR